MARVGARSARSIQPDRQCHFAPGGTDLDEPLRRESLEMLQKGTRTLKEMLAGALEDAQTDSLREECRLEAFDAGMLLGGLCAASQPLARERGLSLRSNGPQSLEVEGDRGKVQRIAQNLLLNAVYYTGRAASRFRGRRDDEDRWSFQVRDTGPGLPDKDSGAQGRGPVNDQITASACPSSGVWAIYSTHAWHMETAPGARDDFRRRLYPGATPLELPPVRPPSNPGPRTAVGQSGRASRGSEFPVHPRNGGR